MAGIRTALDGLVYNQEQTSITLDNGDTKTLARAYKYAPDRQGVPAVPSVINSWVFPEQDNNIAQTVHRYVLTSTWLLSSGSLADSADQAALWWEAWLERWVANPRLPIADGTKTILGGRMRAEDPTVAALEWGGKNYVGFTTHVDAQIERT